MWETRKIAKFKCNRSHWFSFRWMVGLSHYSPSTDIPPRVIWQLVKINHNPDGCCHCLTENVTLGVLRKCGSEHTHGPWLFKVRGRKQRSRGKKNRESSKKSVPPHIVPELAPCFRGTNIFTSTQQVRGKMDGRYLSRDKGGCESSHRPGENPRPDVSGMTSFKGRSHSQRSSEKLNHTGHRAEIPPGDLRCFWFVF